jgi:putative transposase
MPDYRRIYVKGGTYFFTVVSYKRYYLFGDESAINLLRNCCESVITKYPFKIDAIVILPDHLHTIWTLPENDSDFSIRWKLIKNTFSRCYQDNYTRDLPESLIRKKEKGIWQRRFWEHLIRDQEDFNRHCDYIHYNPVKHGFVNSPVEWKHSSFSRFVEQGFYSHDWGKSIEKELIEMNLE